MNDFKALIFGNAKALARRLDGAARALPRTFAKKRVMRASIGAAIAIAAVSVAAVLALLMAKRETQPSRNSLPLALATMDRGHFGLARNMARRLRTDYRDGASLGGGPAFVLGASAAYEAESMWDDRYRGKFYLVAARYLDEARDQGFPPGREAEGLFLLGKSLHESGQHSASIPVLQDALQLNSARKVEIYAMLSYANLQRPTRELANALRWKQEQLVHIQASDQARQQALYEQAEIFFHMGRFSDCRESLDAIPSHSPNHAYALLLRARMLLGSGEQQDGEPEIDAEQSAEGLTEHYAEAMRILGTAQKHATGANRVGEKANYLMGVALKKLRRLDEARKQFSVTRRFFHATPEGLAAGIEEAEILAALGQSEQALEIYQQVLREVGRPETFSNRWISRESIQRRLLEAFDRFIEAEQFPQAVQLAQSFPPMIPRVRAVQAEATAQKAWASNLLRDQTQFSPSQSASARSQAYKLLRSAGRTFARLADLRFTEPEYTDDLWNSATSYLEGNDFENAVRMFQKYTDNEVRRRQPNALVGLGKGLLALGQVDKSIAVFSKCIEFYLKDPIVYEARLLISLAYTEQGDVVRAKQFLMENLHHEDLTPQSFEWRDSLFALGKLLHREASLLETQSRLQGVDSDNPEQLREGLAILEKGFAVYQESIQTLSEAVQRYPDAPPSLEAHYLIAQSHRKAARFPHKKLSLATIGPVRVALRKQQHDQLEHALKAYREIQVLLTKKQESSRLSQMESTVLRNCYFGQGGTLLSLGRYEDAIRVYSAASSRYQQQAESMEAFVQIADCYRRLHRPAEARGTIEQAKVVLGRLDPNLDFSVTTRYSRDEWTEVLQWMSTL